ncbi:hypothetical protein DAPPUDRAFT_119008 [Daphnia pulex]|uniref:Tubulin-specific chaperone D n=1 Tax=Daphnia pulex TaxID=6669 RepID=E9HX77_DAPPU|nr:hypothetical protein DAPPUDRAFT_119008 [Daphnia pulex]|eukprot:EFX63654.1 hypothetical protein DAPPUDRAFT_119008 [Daphnia pulex]
MTLEVADECTQKEIDVIGLGCLKESFTEHSEVEKLIDELRTSAQHQTNQTDIRLVERNWQRILNVCKKYLAGTTKAQDMAFYVSAIYLTRPDVKDSYLPGFINWAHERLSSVLPFMEQAMLYDELRGTRRSTGHFSSRHRHSDHLRLVLLRKNAYLQLSLFVAQYEEYRPHLIQHLVDRKVIHWDTLIRQLTSQALHQMTFLDPESMKLILSTQILPRCTNPILYLRHGSILASGKVISALCQVAKDHQRRLPDELGDAAMESITQTCIDILEARFWRSFGGDPMRIAVCHFIQDFSSGGFPLLDAVVDRWLKALRECLASADSNVQQSAISAVTASIGEYFRHQPVEKLTTLLNHFLPEVTSNNQQARVGNALALGSMPRFLLTVSLPKVIQQLCTCALITDKTLQWAESRKNALKALSLVCTTVGIAPSSPVKMTDGLIFIYFEISLNFIYYYTGGVDQVTLAGIFRTLIDGFEDYTVDSRGDIGAIVRESAMYSIQLNLFYSRTADIGLMVSKLDCKG